MFVAWQLVSAETTLDRSVIRSVIAFVAFDLIRS